MSAFPMATCRTNVAGTISGFATAASGSHFHPAGIAPKRSGAWRGPTMTNRPLIKCPPVVRVTPSVSDLDRRATSHRGRFEMAASETLARLGVSPSAPPGGRPTRARPRRKRLQVSEQHTPETPSVSAPHLPTDSYPCALTLAHGQPPQSPPRSARSSVLLPLEETIRQPKHQRARRSDNGEARNEIENVHGPSGAGGGAGARMA